MTIQQVVLLGIVLLFGTCSNADVIYDVSLDTMALIGNPSAPFALDFQLTSGETTNGIVNTAKISQVHLGQGGNLGTESPFANSGNVAGSLTSMLTLDTVGGVFFTEFSQDFTPGTTLSLVLNLTNIPQPSQTPDEFSFGLVDSTGNEIPTTDPTGGNALLVIDLTGGSLLPASYTTTGDGLTISPIITTPSPEPATWHLFVMLGGGLAAGLAIAKSAVRRLQAISQIPTTTQR